MDLLAHLDLTGNLIDDNRARLLSSGLANNHTITHLCLAHNKVFHSPPARKQAPEVGLGRVWVLDSRECTALLHHEVL